MKTPIPNMFSVEAHVADVKFDVKPNPPGQLLLLTPETCPQGSLPPTPRSEQEHVCAEPRVNRLQLTWISSNQDLPPLTE